MAFNSKIYNSNFNSNSAKYEGGALYSFYSHVVNNTFVNNKAARGEAIYGVDSIIENCSFVNNNNDLYNTGINYKFTNLSDKSDTFSENNYSTDDNEDWNMENSSEHAGDLKKSTGNPLMLLLIGLMIPVLYFKRFNK